ncbi:MAG: hypothetical protein M3Y87_33640, partial [Myxococcota bacterium]|nr:hypothetical protein [Myxococcota bacterium]
ASPIDAASPMDAAVGDGGADASTALCDAMDVREGRACGPTERPALRWHWDGAACVSAAWCDCVGADCDGRFGAESECRRAHATCSSGGACASDDECAAGVEWCEGGRCVECDNSGLACRISCPEGWSIYERNGCHPCACAPVNDCVQDADCGGASECYAGAHCWDWCPEGDASCCFGNVCSTRGCPAPPPVGCTVRGCAVGESCETEMGCAPSSCSCGAGGAWACTRDCGGGVCVAR